MSLLSYNFESKYLQGNTEITVILPDRPLHADCRDFYRKGQKFPVLWLLHGTYGDHTDWVRKSMIEEYACEKNLVVVMPNGLNSDYMDWPQIMKGYEMERYLFDELMPLVYAWLPASPCREHNYIAGLSMGGSGALKLALAHPERFAGAACLSSAPVDLDSLLHEGMTPQQLRGLHLHPNRLVQQTPEQVKNSTENSWRVLFGDQRPENLPRLFFCSGTADNGYQRYLDFKQKAQQAGLPATFEEYEGYRHEWRVWDLAIQRALAFFLEEGDAPKES